MLKNLLSNAFKFTDKGEVTLMIVEDKGESDSKVKFMVKDTGIGINAAKLEYIFDEFYQADGTTTRKYGGTGLGLPISQNLSRLLGGTINAESIEGEGSIFTLHLPDYTIGSLDELNEVSATLLKKVEPTSQEKSEPTVLEEDTLFKSNNQETGIAHLKSKTVLIVDDDMRNVFALTTALEVEGMNVLFAENGQEAIDVLEINREVNIVLMDMMMPIMDGYEAIKRVRNNAKYKDLPIIALTAKAMKHDKEKCIEAGASDYISKPVDIRRLISILKVWICD
ncbi:MAG: response regulator [Bacillaceae bacterium]|nr:response regulator [Bacillaceae bacterium]